MCLPTPEKPGAEGQSDLTYYYAATEELGAGLTARNGGRQEKHIAVINKSTVPVKLINETEELLKKKGAKNFGVVSNPEFLVEGKAIEGTVRPDRIVIGAWNEGDFKVMRKIYQRFDRTLRRGVSHMAIPCSNRHTAGDHKPQRQSQTIDQTS